MRNYADFYRGPTGCYMEFINYTVGLTFTRKFFGCNFQLIVAWKWGLART